MVLPDVIVEILYCLRHVEVESGCTVLERRREVLMEVLLVLKSCLEVFTALLRTFTRS